MFYLYITPSCLALIIKLAIPVLCMRTIQKIFTNIPIFRKVRYCPHKKISFSYMMRPRFVSETCNFVALYTYAMEVVIKCYLEKKKIITNDYFYPFIIQLVHYTITLRYIIDFVNDYILSELLPAMGSFIAYRAYDILPSLFVYEYLIYY